jgi:hypothetical protein
MTSHVDQLRTYLSVNAVATVRNSRLAIRGAVEEMELAMDLYCISKPLSPAE